MWIISIRAWSNTYIWNITSIHMHAIIKLLEIVRATQLCVEVWSAGGVLQARRRGRMEVWSSRALEACCWHSDVQTWRALEAWRRAAGVATWRYRGMEL